MHVEDEGLVKGAMATSQIDRMTVLENKLDRVVDLVEGFGERLQRQEHARDLSPVPSAHSSPHHKRVPLESCKVIHRYRKKSTNISMCMTTSPDWMKKVGVLMFINLDALWLGFIRSNVLYHGLRTTVQQLQGTSNQHMMTLMSFSGHKVLYIVF